MKELNDTQIALMMKCALDFNATVVALASAFYGNMDDEKNIKKFERNYKQLLKGYNDNLKNITGEGL